MVPSTRLMRPTLLTLKMITSSPQVPLYLRLGSNRLTVVPQAKLLHPLKLFAPLLNMLTTSFMSAFILQAMLSQSARTSMNLFAATNAKNLVTSALHAKSKNVAHTVLVTTTRQQNAHPISPLTVSPAAQTRHILATPATVPPSKPNVTQLTNDSLRTICPTSPLVMHGPGPQPRRNSPTLHHPTNCKGKTLLELEETHSGNGKGLRHSQRLLEARDFL
jgi:hypothetical protein